MPLTRDETLRRIKELRDLVNESDDHDEKHPWVNQTLHRLDAASDVIEFPKTERRGDAVVPVGSA